MKLTDLKKQQIILAAVSEFQEFGFSGTSMDRVAQRASVSKRTIYNHFESKDALFCGIVDYMFQMVAETLPRPFDKESHLESQLKNAARQKVELFSSEQFISLSKVTIGEAIHEPQKMASALEQMAAIEMNMANWFKSVAESGQLNMSDPQMACEQFMGLIKTKCFWPRIIKSEVELSETEKERCINETVAMFLARYQRKL